MKYKEKYEEAKMEIFELESVYTIVEASTPGGRDGEEYLTNPNSLSTF